MISRKELAVLARREDIIAWRDGGPESYTREEIGLSLLSLLSTLDKYEEALRFYRDSNNWIAGFGEACSPIIADTGIRASQALEEGKNGI